MLLIESVGLPDLLRTIAYGTGGMDLTSLWLEVRFDGTAGGSWMHPLHVVVHGSRRLNHIWL